MRNQDKYEIMKSIADEVIGGEDELQKLIEDKHEPVCLDGFEPSGRIHIAEGLMKIINVKKLIAAGCKVKIVIADWFALLNNKFGGDRDKIQVVGRYMIEVWKAAGLHLQGDKVEFVWSSEEINSRPDEYWPLVMDIARNCKLPAMMSCSECLGRSKQNPDEMMVGHMLYI